MGASPAALLVLAGYSAAGNARSHGVRVGAPGALAGFDEAALREWCATADLPDLTAAFRASAGGNALAASPQFSGAVSAADMADACKLAACFANDDAPMARAITAAAAGAPGDPGRLARLIAAAAITAAASQLQGLPAGPSRAAPASSRASHAEASHRMPRLPRKGTGLNDGGIRHRALLRRGVV